MKIIITENQNYLLRRVQQFIEIVEFHIEGYELDNPNPWWCSAMYHPQIFFEVITDRSIDDFIDKNWNFFHDNSETGGSEMDISMLNKIVEENYGNYIRNIWVRKCS
jgi:hypothetical protein